MATTLASLRTEIKARILNRSANLTDSRVDQTIMATIRQLASPKVHRHAELEGKETVTTAAGTDIYTMATNIWTIYAVRDTTTNSKRRLQVLGIQQMLEIEKSSGVPLAYSRWGRDIHFDPIPDAVNTVDVYNYSYPTLTLNGSNELTGNSPLNDVYNEGILLGSEYRLWRSVLQDPKRATGVKADLADWMETMISPYDGELDDQEDTLAPDLDGLRGTGR